MTEKKFELGNYVEVKDRIAVLYELYPTARLCTSNVEMLTAPDGKQRVMVTAKAYRTPDDPHPGVGTSWLELPGATPYTRGSEVENAETSAWGRAIGSLGILIDRSIASSQEVQNKAGDAAGATETPASTPRAHPDATTSSDAAGDGRSDETEELVGRVRRRGIIRKGSADGYKLTVIPGPEGEQFGFRLEIDETLNKSIPQCAVAGPLGHAVYVATSEHPETLLGTVATVAGMLYNVKRKGKPFSWYRLHVDLIETDEWILPAPLAEGPVEAPTAPLFDDVAVS